MEELLQTQANGRRQRVGNLHKVKLHSKVAAIELLAKILGLFHPAINRPDGSGGGWSIIIHERPRAAQ